MDFQTNVRMRQIESNADMESCLSLVMPVYNGTDIASEVVNLVLAQRPVQQLVIVDDASTDGIWEKLQALAKERPMIKLARRSHNQSKGATLRTGFSHASAPLVIVQDADLEYDPAEYHRVLAPILLDGCGFGVTVPRQQPGTSGSLLIILLALGGKLDSNHPVEHGNEFEPDKHGSLS